MAISMSFVAVVPPAVEATCHLCLQGHSEWLSAGTIWLLLLFFQEWNSQNIIQKCYALNLVSTE